MRQQCDRCGRVHENLVDINTGEGADGANSKTLCGHCVGALYVAASRLWKLHNDPDPAKRELWKGDRWKALGEAIADKVCPRCKHIGEHGAECQWL